MTFLSTIARTSVADFRERTRSYGFLITLVFGLYAAYLFIPPNDSVYATLTVGGYRGLYNSAWIGTMVAMMTNAFLSLAGFYLVKNTVRRDHASGVGQVIAATRVSNFAYLAGKYLSNLIYLSSIVALLAAAALCMQIVRAEDPSLEFFHLLVPFLVMTLPLISVVAAVAVAFESVGLLRGSIGNIIYFILWVAILTPDGPGGPDLFGYREPIRSIKATAARSIPGYDTSKSDFTLGFTFKDSGQAFHVPTFRWEGAQWTPEVVAGRSSLIVVSLAVVLLSSLLFRRFDEANRGERRRAWRFRRRVSPANDEVPEPDTGESSLPAGRFSHVALTPLSEVANRWNFSRLLYAECALAFKGVTRWWFFIAAVLIILSLTLPVTIVRDFILPFTFVWPILRWSPLGSRESTHGTEQLLFSCPSPLFSRFFALLLSGIVIGAFAGIGLGVRFMLSAEWGEVVGVLAGFSFAAALAVALGTWTGNSKTFEIVYLLLWYIGPMNGFPPLNFARSADSGHAGLVIVLLIATALSALGLLGRKSQSARI